MCICDSLVTPHLFPLCRRFELLLKNVTPISTALTVPSTRAILSIGNFLRGCEPDVLKASYGNYLCIFRVSASVPVPMLHPQQAEFRTPRALFGVHCRPPVCCSACLFLRDDFTLMPSETLRVTKVVCGTAYTRWRNAHFVNVGDSRSPVLLSSQALPRR
jgi:hypothetical protein